jgi:hypothetical protein
MHLSSTALPRSLCDRRFVAHNVTSRGKKRFDINGLGLGRAV